MPGQNLEGSSLSSGSGDESATVNRMTSESIARTAITATDRAEMFELFAAHYEQASEEGFSEDLAGKDWVVLLRDGAHQVQGFTTFALYESTAPGWPVTVVFSGDTIVSSAFRSSTLLPRAWIHSVQERSAGMAQPLYWLLISSGYKTYRFLTVFLKEWYPCSACATPDREQALLDSLAHERFGARYDPDVGVVRLRRPTPLSEGVADLSERRLRDPHVAFFVARNPGHAAGDELACVARLSSDNFTAAGHRLLR